MSAFLNRFQWLTALYLLLSTLHLSAQSTASTAKTSSPPTRPAVAPAAHTGSARDSMVWVRGILTDREAQARMSNVRVFFIRLEKRLMVGVLANEKGEFSRKIAPGFYDIEAQFTGKAALKLENYHLVAGGSYYVRIEMGETESKIIIERKK